MYRSKISHPISYLTCKSNASQSRGDSSGSFTVWLHHICLFSVSHLFFCCVVLFVCLSHLVNLAGCEDSQILPVVQPTSWTEVASEFVSKRDIRKFIKCSSEVVVKTKYSNANVFFFFNAFKKGFFGPPDRVWCWRPGWETKSAWFLIFLIL